MRRKRSAWHLSVSSSTGNWPQVPQGSRRLGPGMVYTLRLPRMPTEVLRLPPGKSIKPRKGVALRAGPKAFCRDIKFPTPCQNKSNKQMELKIPLPLPSSAFWLLNQQSPEKYIFPFFLHLYWKIEQVVHISYHPS